MSHEAEKRFLLKAKEVADGMIPVTLPAKPDGMASLEQAPPGYAFCGGRPQGCSKLVHETEVAYHWTGIVDARDTLCRECQALVRDHALIVCLRCRAVVARIPPHMFPDGFRIEPRRAYHIQYCGNFDCRPDLPSSRIIEGELFNQRKE